MIVDASYHRPAFAERTVERIGRGRLENAIDRIAVETPVAFLYNCQSHAVMMASPRDLVDFAYGFSIAEGIVGSIREIVSVSSAPKGPGMSLSVEIPEDRAAALGSRKRNVAGRTGCGLCGIAEIEQVLRPLPILPAVPPIRRAAIDRAMIDLPELQELNKLTGAVHAAGFADRDGRLLCVREDVGRHNALDKLIGAVLREGLNPADGFVAVTSRCSMEMVQKTASFGCPILVAVSAPTLLAVELAQKSSLTVAAFARGAGFNLYAHPERIA